MKLTRHVGFVRGRDKLNWRVRAVPTVDARNRSEQHDLVLVIFRIAPNLNHYQWQLALSNGQPESITSKRQKVL